MITEIRVQFKDVDLSQRIHYSSLFNYFEVADHHFLREIGYPYNKLFALGYFLPRVHVECDYLGLIEYDDVLQIRISIEKLGNTSFVYLFEFINAESGAAVARGKMANVCIDKNSGKPVQIPDFLREKLAGHLIHSSSI